MLGTDTASALSLEDFAADAFDPFGGAGESTSSSEPPQTTDASDAAGAPPAEPTSTPDAATPAPSESKPEAADSTAAAASPSDAPASPAQSIEPDPFADAAALTYTVNGEARTFDEIKVLKDHGAVIEASALPKLQQRLSERDHLYEASQQAYQKYQDLERLTQWITKGPDGTDQTLTGREALEAQRVALAHLGASLSTLTEVFKGSPLELIGTDDQGNIVWNQQALTLLQTRGRLAEIEAEGQVRTHFGTLAQQTAQQAEMARSQAQLPQQLWAAAEQAWLPQFPTLTAEDKTFLAAQLGHYTRPANVEEVRSGQFKQGEAVLDPSFYQVIADRAQLRATTAKVAQSASTVAKENAARLAAAAAAKAGPQKPPSPKAQQTPANTAKSTQTFNLLEQLAAGRLPDLSGDD